MQYIKNLTAKIKGLGCSENKFGKVILWCWRKVALSRESQRERERANYARPHKTGGYENVRIFPFEDHRGWAHLWSPFVPKKKKKSSQRRKVYISHYANDVCTFVLHRGKLQNFHRNIIASVNHRKHYIIYWSVRVIITEGKR